MNTENYQSLEVLSLITYKLPEYQIFLHTQIVGGTVSPMT